MRDRPWITDIAGLFVGHATDAEALTGCTVVLAPEGAVGGVDVRGSAPGTRETDLLDPSNLVERVHAVVLAGGSAFGLDSAGGVMRWLEEHGHGFDTGVAKVPIVTAAVLYDLALGRPDRRPDAAMGYAACEDALAGGGNAAREDAASGKNAAHGRRAQPVLEGNVGAGAGASAGKLFGPFLATKTGLGTACLAGPNGLLVGAVVAVNAFGDVRDPATGAILAGTRNPAGGWAGTAATLAGVQGPGGFGSAGAGNPGGARGAAPAGGPASGPGENTTIGVVATNAALGKAQARKVAQMAHDGLALTISPVHTMLDGDTIFALSLGGVAADVTVVGTLAVRAVAEAVVRAALAATAAGGLPSAGDLMKQG